MPDETEEETPSWLTELMDDTAGNVEAMMPGMEERELQWRAFYDDEGFECWQAHLMPTPLETLAGERHWCGGLVVHIDDVASLFDRWPEIKFSVDHDEIFFCGAYQGREVVLIIYTAPPEDEPTQGLLLQDGSVRWIEEQADTETN